MFVYQFRQTGFRGFLSPLAGPFKRNHSRAQSQPHRGPEDERSQDMVETRQGWAVTEVMLDIRIVTMAGLWSHCAPDCGFIVP